MSTVQTTKAISSMKADPDVAAFFSCTPIKILIAERRYIL